MPAQTPSPVNPLPPVVVALFLFMAGIELLFSLGERGILGTPAAVGWRLQAVQDYAFSGDIFDWMLRNGYWPMEHLIRFVTYPFVHTAFTHALFSCVMLLALGKIVGEVLGGWRTLLVFVVSGAGGALFYGLLLDDAMPLVGGFPPIYGLIGAFTYMLWLRLGQVGEQQMKAFSLIGVLLFLQLLFGVLFGGGLDWVADVAAFVCGFGLVVLFTPGGWRSLMARIRRD
ncbi:rhomboid family intramembrane serine protease [Primorskyibacter sp. S187A]|uniref:rhomboid family intramembrane serine protease n=1 Tax=Primorskyibacter sp. S187A TaxID=3415130 RepID=UPI003C7E16F9